MRSICSVSSLNVSLSHKNNSSGKFAAAFYFPCTAGGFTLTICLGTVGGGDKMTAPRMSGPRCIISLDKLQTKVREVFTEPGEGPLTLLMKIVRDR